MEDQTKKLLVELKQLPKYQFERRIDIFILEYLDKTLSKILKENVHFLYPEFPLQSLKKIKGKLNWRNTNVDYLLASKDTFYFVELKTDAKSFKKDSQLSYYSYYSKKPFKELFEFFQELADPINHLDKKWKVGFDYLNDKYKESFDVKLDENLNKDIKIIYLVPSTIINNKKYKKQREKLEEELGKKLIFVSLKDFANKISNDENLKSLLEEIDEE